MSENSGDARVRTSFTLTRRATLLTTLAMPFIARRASAQASSQATPQTRPVTKVAGIETTADVAKAEAEGTVVFYTNDSETAGAAVVEAFGRDFPKIKGSYIRAQNGALYSKVMAERSAGRFNVDVIQFSEVGTAMDFQKRGGYVEQVSPETAAYPGQHGSSPPGYFVWNGVTFGGIAYNTDKVSAEEAPKTWQDLLDPRWRNALSCKQATSGMQFIAWFELRKLYGDDYWKKFANQRPRGFDSRAQLFDRLSRGDDKVCALAEYGGYGLFKQKGAPIAFVAPPDGLPATPIIAGVVANAPHPEAARLLMDWLVSLRGQTFFQDDPNLFYGSIRADAPPMPGGKRLSSFKLLAPTPEENAIGARDTFNKQWNGLLGL